jgi:hypothetical protein
MHDVARVIVATADGTSSRARESTKQHNINANSQRGGQGRRTLTRCLFL